MAQHVQFNGKQWSRRCPGQLVK